MMNTDTKTKARFHLSQQARRRVALTTLICAAFGDAYALPFGEQVQAGNVVFERGAQYLNINQASQQAIVNWQSFSIAANEAVRLNQPAQGVALFRVVGSDPSQIFGSLTATGSLFLSNPNGVLFGRGAQVDVGSLVATTMRIDNDHFLAGRYQFYGDEKSSVVNNGIIRTEDGGYIALLGSTVENNGSLVANSGSVIMGSAQSAILDMYGDGLVRVKLDGDALNAVVKQTGNITADGGSVQLATNARTAAINVDGVIQANSLVERNGVIRLEGAKNAKVSVNGTLSAAGNESGSTGGLIEVTGEQVALFKNANLDASGQAGGGTVLVGGDLQGKNAQVFNARTTYVDKDAIINVDALNQGDGGKAIVWADNATRYYGKISAKGGASSGNGGFAEVSGKQYLDFLGKADLSAVNGLGGHLLLDPLNIILTTADANTAGFTPPGDITEAFLDDAGLNSTFNVNAGGSFAGIAAGSTITLQATNNITVSSAFNVATATGSANNNLVLQANNNIAVNSAVTTTGTGAITMQADADNSGAGNLAIGANITSQSGGITLFGATITRSAGNISANGAANADAGNINITSTGSSNLGTAAITASGGAASAGNSGRNGGSISISAGGYNGTGAITVSGSSGSGANTNGGNAGTITIASTNGINLGAGIISGNGGNAGTGNGNSGNAGIINISNSSAGAITTGLINARVGVAIGTGTGGAAGSVTVANTASGNLTTGAITTSGNNNSNGNGGNIQLSTAIGNIGTGALATSGGTVRTGNSGKNAGSISINSGGSYTGTTITASGTAGLGINQSGGHAANITINANNGIAATTIAASGGNATATNGNGGNAGVVALTNNTIGNITTTTITARNGNATGAGTGGTAGGITASNNAIGGTVTTTALSTQGGTLGHGGNINVSALGNTSVNGTVNSAGGTSLTGNVGRNAGSVNVSSGANVVVGAVTSSGSAGLGTNQNGGAGGAVTLTSGSSNTITHNSISSAGGARTGTGTAGNGANININGNALLSANSTINASVGTGGVIANSGAINFNGTVNSIGANRTLVVNTTGATTFAGAVGNTLALTSLTTNASGTTAINGGSVTTTGTQTYGDAVTTNQSTTFSTTNSNVTFGSSVIAAGNTVVSVGAGAVTATNSANNFNNLAITAGSANIRDGGAIVLGDTNVSGNYTLQSGASITQSAPVTVGGITTLNSGASSDITLNNTTNNFSSVTVTSARDVQIQDANALTVNASSLRTIDARALGGNLTLGGNIVATGNTPTTSISLSASQNFINAGNFNLTPGAGKRWLVYSSSPLFDTRGANLLTAYDFKQYNSAFGDPILGTGDGFIYSLAPQITPTLGGVATKTYDGNTTAPIASLTIGQTGAVDGDTVNISALTSATYDNKNTGTGKTVTSNALSITGATNGGKQVFGYTLASPSASGNVGTINQAILNLNAVTDTKQYDGNTNSSGIVATSGLVLGDTISGLSQSFASKNVLGSNASTLNVDAGFTLNDGNGGNNYSLITNSASGTITPLAITGSITANNKTYDGNNTATIATRNLAGVIGLDDVAYTGGSATFIDKNAATGKTVTATGLGLTGLDAGNYTVNDTAIGTADIAKADISAVTGITANNKVYDATTGATLNTGAAGFVGIIGLDNLNVTTANGNFVDANAGAGKTVNITGIGLGGADAGNYNLLNTTATTTSDITQRAITVTANSGQSKVFGASDPLSFTFTVGGLGLVGGDTLAGALSRDAGEAVGSYAINQGSLASSSNYILSYVGNSFNIFAPSSSTSGGNPRNAAGLVDLSPSLTNYTNPQLFVLNVGATAAGADSEGQAGCEQDPESLAKDKDFILMLNYGLNLPKGLNTSCDNAKI